MKAGQRNLPERMCFPLDADQMKDWYFTKCECNHRCVKWDGSM